MASKPRKKHDSGEEEVGETAPIWIVSFADLVVLLMGFFVILSAGQTKDAATDPEFAKLVAAIRDAFKYVPNPMSNDPVDMTLLELKGLLNQKRRGKSGTSKKRGEAHKNVQGMQGVHQTVQTVREGTKTTIGGRVEFDKDSTELGATAKAKVARLATQIQGHLNVFIVKGHTSRDEEFRLKDQSRDLSYERAQVVAVELVRLGIDRVSLRLQPCRDYEPLKAGAYSDTARAGNRRVEVVATESLVSEYKGDRVDIDPQAESMLNQGQE